jgi:hypothetical protein
VNACTVCQHPQSAAMDALIETGARSLRSLAVDFGLGVKAVQRHALHYAGIRGSHPGLARQPRADQAQPGQAERALPQPGEIQAPASPGEPLDSVTELRAQLAALNAMDQTAMSTPQRLGLMDAKRRTAEALGRALPPPSGRVEVNDVDGLPEFIAILFEELEPYLDVRLRIAQRMKDEGIAALMGGTEA